MATKTVSLTDTAYTQLDTTTESAVDCQNVSTRPVLVVFATSQPAVSESAYYYLDPGQGVTRDGKTGDMWARALSRTASVTVGE